MNGTHAIVVGAGIGGLTSALCLAAIGWRVTIIERAPVVEGLGAGIQLSPNATRVLVDLGLGSSLEEQGVVPEAITMRDWRTGRIVAHTELGRRASDKFGAPYYHIHRGDLIGILKHAVSIDGRVELLTSAEFQQVKQENGQLTTEISGNTLHADILIGADGIHSAVRKHLAGEEPPRFTGNVAWRALVPAARVSPALREPRASVWLGPGHHLVHYPVAGGRLVNVVAVAERQAWAEESWSEPADPGELQREFEGWHASVQALMAEITADNCFKWGLFDRPPLRRWGAGHVVLVGDACHPVLPFMAQGAAMAIEDAAVLTNCLEENPVADAISRYAQLRRSRTRRVQRLSRRNARVYHLSGPAAWLRNRVIGFAGDRVMDWLWRYDPLLED